MTLWKVIEGSGSGGEFDGGTLAQIQNPGENPKEDDEGDNTQDQCHVRSCMAGKLLRNTWTVRVTVALEERP